MNRLRKFADEQLSLDFNEKINSFDDYLRMYNENYISDFLENKEKEHNTLYYKNKVVANKSAVADELCNMDDSIGEKTSITNYIDVDSRIAAFVDIDRQIFVSDHGQTHAQLINEYLKKYDKKLNDDWYRPDIEEISEKNGAEKIAFGHIVNDNVWIIEYYTLTDISIEDVVSDIKASGKEYTKIYSYNFSNATRVAQLEKK